MYVLAHTWLTRDEQRCCATVLVKIGLPCDCHCPRMQVRVGGADKRNGVKSQSKDKQGSVVSFPTSVREVPQADTTRGSTFPTQPHLTHTHTLPPMVRHHPTASIPPIPNLRDCLTSISTFIAKLAFHPISSPRSSPPPIITFTPRLSPTS